MKGPGASLLSLLAAAGSRGTMCRVFRTLFQAKGSLEHRLEKTAAHAGIVAELEQSCFCSGHCSSMMDVQSSSCELHHPQQGESRFLRQDGAWWQRGISVEV